jgi:hypothetical protein
MERLRLCKVPFLEPQEGLKLVLHAREVLANYDHPGLNLTANLRFVQCQLRLGNLPVALKETQAILQVFPSIIPELIYRAEVLLTVIQVLSAAQEPDTEQHCQHALSWVLETTRNQVPTEYRESFLNVNPTNRAILELARASGIETTTLVTQ